MLSLQNSYCHGYVAAPLIDACRRLRLFATLDCEAGITVEALAAQTSTHAAYLRIALHFLHCLGWVACQRDEQGQAAYRLTPAAQPQAVPEGLCALYQISPRTLLDSVSHQALLAQCLAQVPAPTDPPPEVAFIAGPVLAPLLSVLYQFSQRRNTAGNPLAGLPAPLRQAAVQAMRLQGWVAQDSAGDDAARLTDIGRHMIAHAPVMGIALSYRPMLAQLETLLTGDRQTVFALDADGNERHVERILNVQASGFQHHRYFHDAQQLVVRLFDNPDFAKQPHYIADMGCGDGSFLRQLYEAIRKHSRRGQVLDAWPLTLIGIDLHAAALHATEATLAGLPHLLMTGDVNDPQRLLSKCSKVF